MIGRTYDTLKLLGFTEEEADKIRKKALEKKIELHKEVSTSQEGFLQVYERLNNDKTN